MLRTLFAGKPALLGSAFAVALAVTPAATKIDGKPFNASVMDLANQGYVEEEFFITGTARTYDIPRDQMSNGTPADATHSFKTRIFHRQIIDSQILKFSHS